MMLKETIDLIKIENHINGYGYLKIPNNDSYEVLDKLVEWSQGKNVKIYKHHVRTREENIDYNGQKYEFRANNCPPQDIPYCDLIIYLEIYYQ